MESIKSKVKSEMEQVIRTSEDHIANAEYREAVTKLDIALELDPNNAQARKLYDQASKELYKKMKALFSDSVVEESLGNVEPAKIKWRKIVEQDSPKGEYRQKAMIKLKKYGE
jgi:tetratricopeptide (TPR) repeat protein